MSLKSAAKKAQTKSAYDGFSCLNGEHPWMQAAPEGFVAYRARELGTGKVTYLNFALAKEMGLLDSNHPHEMNSELEKKLIETFSIQIINEYDELNKRRINQSTIKPHSYMATRYLQLQHSDKRGTTSGDGRCVWNGVVKHRGKVWDVSSRGTGVTCLAPGAVEAQKPLKTGGTDYGYGCGQAEVDELYGCAIMAEIMHLQGINTERVLCVIDFGNGYGIGVRTAPNLIRPAHIFMYLKQDRYTELQSAVNYLIERQERNDEWFIKSVGYKKYDEMLELLCRDFAKFTAILDVEYIFAWLDWDGDNVLASAGIIDYGSVRQFGLRHDQYRYDDVDRFSTNLNEQKNKAREMIQVFAQIVDYLKTKKKKPLKEFRNHPITKKFNFLFNKFREERLLYKMGFNPEQRQKILTDHRKTLRKFDQQFCYFERVKTKAGIEKVADGINKRALFNMRKALRELPAKFASQTPDSIGPISEDDFFKLILSESAKPKDSVMQPQHRYRIKEFQTYYIQLLKAVCPDKKTLTGISERSQTLNRTDRITGNALIQIVDEIMTFSKKGAMKPKDFQRLIDRIILEQGALPEVNVSRHVIRQEQPSVKKELFARINELVLLNNEEI